MILFQKMIWWIEASTEASIQHVAEHVVPGSNPTEGRTQLMTGYTVSLLPSCNVVLYAPVM